jgi:hypothetical protein
MDLVWGAAFVAKERALWIIHAVNLKNRMSWSQNFFSLYEVIKMGPIFFCLKLRKQTGKETQSLFSL